VRGKNFQFGRPCVFAVMCAASTLMFSLEAYGQGTNLEATSLEGQWVLVQSSGRPVPTEAAIFFKLENGILSGFDGCNRFGGPLDGGIRTGGRGCPDSGPVLPLDLAQPAEHLARARRDGDKLILPLADGSTAEFVRKAD
jgi:META domain